MTISTIELSFFLAFFLERANRFLFSVNLQWLICPLARNLVLNIFSVAICFQKCKWTKIIDGYRFLEDPDWSCINCWVFNFWQQSVSYLVRHKKVTAMSPENGNVLISLKFRFTENIFAWNRLSSRFTKTDSPKNTQSPDNKMSQYELRFS